MSGISKAARRLIPSGFNAVQFESIGVPDRRSWTNSMPRYYFDTRDGPEFIRDELGIARDALPGSVRRELAVECRDEADRDVLRAALWFEVAVLVG
jgi:hypothetical protein